jgi:hypothetical protein
LAVVFEALVLAAGFFAAGLRVAGFLAGAGFRAGATGIVAALDISVIAFDRAGIPAAIDEPLPIGDPMTGIESAPRTLSARGNRARKRCGSPNTINQTMRKEMVLSRGSEETP